MKIKQPQITLLTPKPPPPSSANWNSANPFLRWGSPAPQNAPCLAFQNSFLVTRQILHHIPQDWNSEISRDKKEWDGFRNVSKAVLLKNLCVEFIIFPVSGKLWCLGYYFEFSRLRKHLKPLSVRPQVLQIIWTSPVRQNGSQVWSSQPSNLVMEAWTRAACEPTWSQLGAGLVCSGWFSATPAKKNQPSCGPTPGGQCPRQNWSVAVKRPVERHLLSSRRHNCAVFLPGWPAPFGKDIEDAGGPVGWEAARDLRRSTSKW